MENANAAELPESTNNRDMKRMKISCQVTAAISLLEILGNIACAVIWLFIAKYVGHESLIMGLTLYFIFLPYAFLMNTRHNRNLVFEDGWGIVIKNLFGGDKLMNCFKRNQVHRIKLSSNDDAILEKPDLTERDIRIELYEVSRQHTLSYVKNIHADISALNAPINEENDAIGPRKRRTKNR